MCARARWGCTLPTARKESQREERREKEGPAPGGPGLCMCISAAAVAPAPASARPLSEARPGEHERQHCAHTQHQSPPQLLPSSRQHAPIERTTLFHQHPCTVHCTLSWEGQRLRPQPEEQCPGACGVVKRRGAPGLATRLVRVRGGVRCQGWGWGKVSGLGVG